MRSFTVPALLLASVNFVLAQTQYYNLVGTASDGAFDGSLLKPYDRFWHVGINAKANSTCGDVAPALGVFGSSLGVYNDGKSNQQFVYVDTSGAADGLLALTPADAASGLPKGFRIGNGDHDAADLLYYDNGVLNSNEFLACADASVTGDYWVYPANSYGKEVGKEACIKFKVQAVPVDTPTTPCTFH